MDDPGDGAFDGGFEVLGEAAVGLSHAMVRSTTHRLGRSSKPLAVSERLMISRLHAQTCASAISSLGPA